MMDIAVGASLASLALSFVLSVVRLILGPSLPDRVVAVDLMGAFAIGTMAVTAISLDSPALIQPALVLAFVAFLATVAFARYIAKAGAQHEDKP
jgi:multicomponent Na+:H+ antiporter subunit F